MTRKTGKNGKGFGKPKLLFKPDYEAARMAGIVVSHIFSVDVEFRKCNFCTDYYLLIPEKEDQGCDRCGKVDYQLIEVINQSTTI
jgi:hypothetical protein